MTDRSRWATLAALCCALATPAFSETGIRITPSGSRAVLYDWSRHRCTDLQIPDSPLRAFRDAKGDLAVFATHRENWALRGKAWSDLRPDCRTVLSSRAQTETALGNLWIAATYTLDGRNVTALVSEDQTEDEVAAGCRQTGAPGQCWLNNLLIAQSSDGGENFALLPKDQRLLATIGEDYPLGDRSRFGVFTASNIVLHDGAYFMLAFAEGTNRQPRGNCLFRTTKLYDRHHWRAYDGKAFQIDMGAAATPRACMPLGNLPNEVRSLSHVPGRNLWIAVYASRQTQKNGIAVPGFYFSHSADLIEWSKPQLIMPAPTRPREQQRDYFVAYPVLIDPLSRSRNFETIDSESAWLVYTIQHLRNGQGSLDRDLVYMPVRLE